jgi:putative PD-(D/E)XK family protein DUF4420
VDLLGTFRLLPRPARPGTYAVGQSTDQVYRVGRSFSDHAVILIAFEAAGGASAPRRLANISYSPPTSVEIIGPEGDTRPSRMAILECMSDDTQLAAYFFRVVSSVLLDPALRADEAAFDRALDALVALFRAIQRPGTQSVQGLWAELAMIAWSNAPGMALSAWHSVSNALHDFSAGNDRLEVKSTTRALREHTFRLEQLSRHAGGRTLIASFILEESNDGATIDDLVAVIANRTGSGEALRRLEVIVAESIGADWREAQTQRFDVDAARRELRFYPAEKVPTIAGPIPPEIKDVRFVADLSTCIPLDSTTARGMGSLFQALLSDQERVTTASQSTADKS